MRPSFKERAASSASYVGLAPDNTSHTCIELHSLQHGQVSVRTTTIADTVKNAKNTMSGEQGPGHGEGHSYYKLLADYAALAHHRTHK